MTGIILILIGVIGYFVFKKQKQKNYINKALSIMANKNNFQPDYYQIMVNYSGAIAISFNQKLICVVDESDRPFYLSKKNIQNTDILIDETTYHQKDFIKTWGKYLVLKSLGSESTAEASVHIAKENHINKINTLKLRIQTNNLNTPNLYLTFLKNGTENHKRKIINDVYDWVSRIETIKTQ